MKKVSSRFWISERRSSRESEGSIGPHGQSPKLEAAFSSTGKMERVFQVFGMPGDEVAVVIDLYGLGCFDLALDRGSDHAAVIL